MFYRRYSIPSIQKDLDRIQREMNRLFDDSYSSPTHGLRAFPRLNVWADENSALVTAEIPGITPDEIEIIITGDTLTLKGERAMPDLPESAKYHRQERSYGFFSRNLELPFNISADDVSAKFTDGVLEILLPRTEQDKPKKIVVSHS